MRVVVFHYHLNPGGVTGVITRALAALLEVSPDLEEVIIVSGSGDNAGHVVEVLADERLRIEILPEIGYREHDTSAARCREQARGIRHALLQRYRGHDTVWWVHNYHLGKNPAFTRALLEIAASGRQRMLLHIHDFPECGRYENLARLHQACGYDLYPTASSVSYAAINQRDRSLLSVAGIDDCRAWLIPNPVVTSAGPAEPSDEPSATRVLGRLHAERAGSGGRPGGADPARSAGPVGASGPRRATGAGGTGLCGTPDGRLLFYPVRCIRRKNVLEAGLLARLLEHQEDRPCNLVVTLPGVSVAEQGYSRMVEAVFDAGDIRGYFGVGEWQAPSFDQLALAADLVVSTSVQEGFGYAFFDPLCWGRPLVARELDTLCGSVDLFHDYPACLYDALQVPVEISGGNGTGSSGYGYGVRENLRSAYQRQIKRMEAGLGADLVERVEAQLESLLGGATIDFSYLAVDTQRNVLRRIGGDDGFRKEVLSLNAGLVTNALQLAGSRCTPRREALAERFGPHAVARRLHDALTSCGSPPAGCGDQAHDAEESGPAAERGSAGDPTVGRASPAEIHLRIMEAFAAPQYARLLYAPYP